VSKEGTLYICGTPIGNLRDITLRALDTLEEVNLIAAEDTRRTQKLLNYYDLETKLTSYHEHNAEQKKDKLLKKLKEGQQLALVSDAGMPGISDPGFKLVRLVKEAGIEVVPIPGPTAAVNALVASGLPTDRFAFEGFLPKKKERKRFLKQLKNEERTLVFYESPYRIVDTLKDMLDIFGNREVAVCRELTKKFEEIVTAPLNELISQFKTDQPKGEFTLVVEGGSAQQEAKEWKELSILDHVKQEMKEGLTKKKAIKKVAKLRDLPKSEVYQIATKIRVDV
jgi:16S rRNA (cytidine1402-2'-O)-methyltransferase